LGYAGGLLDRRRFPGGFLDQPVEKTSYTRDAACRGIFSGEYFRGFAGTRAAARGTRD
jgi:hypothetical protein